MIQNCVDALDQRAGCVVADKSEFSGWETAKRAGAFVLSNAAPAARTCGLWLALIAGATIALAPAAVWLVQNSTEFASFVRSFKDERVLQLMLAVPLLLMMAIAWPSIAVAWHRFVLRGEQPAILPVSPRRGGLYLLLASAFYLVVWILPGAALGYVFTMMRERPNIVVFLVWVAIFAGLLALSMRFSLKLRAIAVSDRDMTMVRSWRETNSIWPGMLWGTVVLTVPLFFATKAVDVLAGRLADQGETEISMLLAALNFAVGFIGLLLYATFLSFSYQRAVGDTSSTFD